MYQKYSVLTHHTPKTVTQPPEHAVWISPSPLQQTEGKLQGRCVMAPCASLADDSYASRAAEVSTPTAPPP